ncbi:MAG: TolC family protein [Opitutaceae bacterium]
MKSLASIFSIHPLAGLLVCAPLVAGAQNVVDTPPPPALHAIIGTILAENPELAFYEAEIAAAKAARLAAGTRADPELSIDIGRKRVTAAGGMLAGEGTAWSVSLAQTFEWPGRLALRKAIANHDLALAELGLARFKAALAQRTRLLAYGLHAAHERAAAAAEVAARYQALRELFLARDPGGLTPLLETRVIEAQELTLQQRATDAQLAVQAALVELNQLRGAALDAPLAVGATQLAYGAAPTVESALAAARENNFEFRSARLELEQQGLVVSLARNEGRPSVTVSPYYSQAQAGDTERIFGVGFSLPLPVSGRASANVAAAEARRRQAEVAALVARRTMERAVIAAAQSYAAKIAEIQRWAPDSATRFRDAAALADRHYRLGAVPLSTYVELQNAYLEAIDALHETQQEALDAAGQLQLLTGLEIEVKEVQP